MTCPRCSLGEIPEGAPHCPVCGYQPWNDATLDAPAPTLDDAVAAEFGSRFSIERLLRSGPRSSVYLVQELDTERAVALKVIPRGPALPAEMADRFQRAMAVAATLDHPHIVSPYDHGATEGLLWYAMEYVPSRSLDEELEQGGRLTLPRTLRLAHQLGSALDYAHGRGVTHGALKPADVLLEQGGWARLVDFAVPHDDCAEEALDYLAPEQLQPLVPPGPAADQYALAAIVRTCLTGAAASSSGTIPPDVATHVVEALQRATARRPADRFPGVLAFVAALAGAAPAPRPLAFKSRSAQRGPPHPVLLIEPEPEPLPPHPPRPSLLRPARRRRLRTATTLGLGLVLGSFLLLRAWPDRRAAAVAVPTPVTQVEPAPPAAGPASQDVPVPAVEAPRPAPAAPAPARPQAKPPQGRATPAPAALGYLFASSIPWAEVYVDGRHIGNTPLLNYAVAAGLHTVRFTRDGFETYETRISVSAGDSVRVTSVALKGLTP